MSKRPTAHRRERRRAIMDCYFNQSQYEDPNPVYIHNGEATDEPVPGATYHFTPEIN